MSIIIENVQIFGWEGAIRGARNPMNSWEKSDTIFKDNYGTYPSYNVNSIVDFLDPSSPLFSVEEFTKYSIANAGMHIGPADHKLLMNLCKGGTEEAKWRRMVHVQMDITAPLYWWKEFETYKVGTTSNSCSTMHKIQAKEFTLDDFSCEKLMDHSVYIEDVMDHSIVGDFNIALEVTIKALNDARDLYLQTKDKRFWWQMIQLLPTSYNQRRTIDLNYEVLASQYRQRKDHKLDCWRQYCDWIKSLPYSEFITMEVDKDVETNF